MIEKHTISVLIFFLLSLGLFAAEPFALPKGTEVINRDNSGKTWQMNGSLKMGFAEAKKTLSTAVQKAGFKLKHEIPLDEKNKEHILLSWIKGKQALIMMLWSGDKKTFFSWGIAEE